MSTEMENKAGNGEDHRQRDSYLADVMDKILDCELEGSSRGLGQASELSDKFKLFIPLSILPIDGKFLIRYHVSAQDSTSREIRLFLETVKAQHTDGNWTSVIDEEEINATWKTTLKELAEIKTTVILLSYLDGGIVKFRIRFHHSNLDDLSRLILGTKSRSQSMSIDYLGKSRGAKRIFREISQKIPLTCLKFHSKMPAGSGVIGNGWVREVRSTSSHVAVDAIYRFESPPEEQEKFEKISDNIYEGVSKEELHEFFTKRANDLGVIRLSRVQRFSGSDIETEIVLPSIHSGTYLSILSEANTRFPSWNIKLISVSDVNEEMTKGD